MEFQDILFQKTRGIVKITLNRPSVLNALSPNLVQELKIAAEQVAKDLSAKVLIVTGAGKAFSAGVDLQALNESIKGGQFSADQILKDGLELMHTLATMPQVSIAMVNGHCYTGAMELMMGFDLIYAADEAQIGDTHAKWGIAPKWGMTQRLPQLVGILKARELSFTTRAVSGQEAEKIGLVNQSVPLAELENYVSEVAQKIEGNSAQTIAAMKKLYYEGWLSTLREGLELEQQSHFIINDREEFLRAFKENKKK